MCRTTAPQLDRSSGEQPPEFDPEEIEIVRDDERRVYLKHPCGSEGPVRLRQAFPLTEPDRYLMIEDRSESRFLGMVKEYKQLDRGSLAVVEEELEREYFLPKILRINEIDERFRIMIWDVETDRGQHVFEVKSRRRDIRWLSDDHVVIRDIDGNKYEIPDLSELDDESQDKIELEV